jgi:hypothetical protein
MPFLQSLALLVHSAETVGMSRRLHVVFCASLLILSPVSAAQRPVEFNRDVRPILADHCFTCHGPDAKQRQADLRLDVPEGADRRDGSPVAVAGKPETSELWRRIVTPDETERMPPADKGRALDLSEQETIRQWILSGAKFEKHWSLLPVRRPEVIGILRVPSIANGTRSVPTTSGPLDSFIRARLAEEGLQPSPEADRWTLLRRVTLGLTGLPPTVEEIEAFEADMAPDAYERAVDRLLASPRYGERMASPWLDAARYADTSGYQSDGERHMWRWRDWVIDALNANMPFDQFTIEQVAGDLLPNPTLEQQIATGFNRNHRGNAEGGIIPEEYAVEYVADRVETTATVWLGLTLGCARCHDHKYDPFSQRDFYSLFAFFNNIPEKGRAIKIGNSPPYLKAPTRLQEQKLANLAAQHHQARARAAAMAKDHQPHFEMWQKAALSQQLGNWYPEERLAAHVSFEEDPIDNSIESSAGGERELRYGSSPLGRAAEFDGTSSIALEKEGNFGFFDKFTLAAWVKVDSTGGGTIVSRMTDVPQGDGYQLAIVAGKLQLNLVKRWLDDALRVESAARLSPGDWHHVAATYDGSRVADGVRLYVDGRPEPLNALLDELNQSFAVKEPLRIGGGGGAEGRFRGAIDEVRVYSGALPQDDVEILATPQSLTQILARPADKRTPGQQRKLDEYYLWHAAPSQWQAAERAARQAARAFAEFEENLPTVMVMEEMPTPRETHFLVRGQYDKPGERVEADVPAELPRLHSHAPRNRLGFAQWLVSKENPLTSRVIVNRAWQLHFGTGLVKTSEDFGRQGEWPSHPELLDWLASELIESGWDLKRLHRAVVTSATYRQSSMNSELRIQNSKTESQNSAFRILNSAFASDPDNRLLSRGPRLRLSAEMVRDQALFASGLLVEQRGGPSVRPLQPEGLWSELTGGDDYKPGKGAELVRRSLYTFWKRTIPPPAMATFDASSREACIVRDSRTNTPLQALALLNEPTMVIAARALAERVMHESNSPNERIERAMLHAVGRKPTADELEILHTALKRYEQRPGGDLAAYALVCSTILNLDEAVTSQ